MQDTPTLVPADPFVPFDDASALRKGIHRLVLFSPNAIIGVLCHRVGTQRAEVAAIYEHAYGITLREDLETKLYGNFEGICIALGSSLTDYLAADLHRLMACSDNDPDSVVEVLLGTSKSDMSKVKSAYENGDGVTLEADIESKYSGSVQKLLAQLSDGKDNSTLVINYFVRRDVANLYNAGQATINGTDEDVFIDIFAKRGYNHLNAIYEQYEAQYGDTMESVIQSEFDGDMERLMLDIIEYSRAKATYFAERLHQTIDGLGTRNEDLMRLIITRSEVDLGDIKTEYERLYGTTLVSDIKRDTAGNFEKALRHLIG